MSFTEQRNANGVKVRVDGKGDGWANEHRQKLAADYYFQDMDAMFGYMAFGQNTGEKLFLEYVPDDFVNRVKSVRKFGVVGMFDRKASREFAFSNANLVSCAFYMWICRTIGQVQPITPKFFYVIGGNSPPWEMIELNVETGEPADLSILLESTDWHQTWKALGLSEMRRELKQWIKENR